MICSSCLRNVPDLVGPQYDVCPECYGVEAEAFMPSLHDPWASDASGWEEPWYLEDFLKDVEEDLLLALEEGETLREPPTFRGRPRFKG